MSRAGGVRGIQNQTSWKGRVHGRPLGVCRVVLTKPGACPPPARRDPGVAVPWWLFCRVSQACQVGGVTLGHGLELLEALHLLKAEAWLEFGQGASLSIYMHIYIYVCS